MAEAVLCDVSDVQTSYNVVLRLVRCIQCLQASMVAAMAWYAGTQHDRSFAWPLVHCRAHT